jgi:diaminopimelate decarboxylase
MLKETKQFAGFDFAASAQSVAAVLPAGEVKTPARIFLEVLARENLRRLAREVATLDRFRVAYSVKTNPRDELLELVRAVGFFAEVISHAEFRHVLARGFEPSNVLYNGPVPVGDLDVAVAFADSVEAFERNAARTFRRAHGVRLRPRGVASRFGVDAEEERRLVRAIERSPHIDALACSFFTRSEDIAHRTFVDVAREIADRAADLERATGKPVVLFDIGGGCSPAEFNQRLRRDLPRVADIVVRTLPNVGQVVIEPGQEVTTPCEAVVARVLEVRQRESGREIVVDCGLPAIPQIADRRHRAFVRTDAGWREMGEGADRILGCICMEEDIIRRDVALPEGPLDGALIAIADTGAYDSSMAFNFARGREVPEPA